MRPPDDPIPEQIQVVPPTPGKLSEYVLQNEIHPPGSVQTVPAKKELGERVLQDVVKPPRHFFARHPLSSVLSPSHLTSREHTVHVQHAVPPPPPPTIAATVTPSLPNPRVNMPMPPPRRQPSSSQPYHSNTTPRGSSASTVPDIPPPPPQQTQNVISTTASSSSSVAKTVGNAHVPPSTHHAPQLPPPPVPAHWRKPMHANSRVLAPPHVKSNAYGGPTTNSQPPHGRTHLHPPNGFSHGSSQRYAFPQRGRPPHPRNGFLRNPPPPRQTPFSSTSSSVPPPPSGLPSQIPQAVDNRTLALFQKSGSRDLGGSQSLLEPQWTRLSKFERGRFRQGIGLALQRCLRCVEKGTLGNKSDADLQDAIVFMSALAHGDERLVRQFRRFLISICLTSQGFWVRKGTIGEEVTLTFMF